MLYGNERENVSRMRKFCILGKKKMKVFKRENGTKRKRKSLEKKMLHKEKERKGLNEKM